MAYNPKETRKPMLKAPSIPISGKPAVILTQLKRLELMALDELKYKKTQPLKTPAPFKAPPPKEAYYMEWWQIGDDQSAIQVAEFDVAYIKPFIKTFMASGKYTLIYLERKSDGKIIWNRRSR